MYVKEKKLAEFFKVFSDSTRVRVLYALMDSEFCVNELADELNMNQSAVSHQLRVLRDSRMINARRSGKQMLYSMADNHVKTLIQEGEKYLMLQGEI